MKKKVLLKASWLGKKYKDKPVFQDLILTIPENTFIAILGASGSGKSTLLNILQGLEKPSSGKVEYFVERSAIQFVFQNYTLFPWLSCMQNIVQPLIVQGASRKQAQKKALVLLKEVGLEQKADLYPHELSGGMKQRVAIARALALEPKVLLMDEPFGALDTCTRQDLHKLLLKLFDTHKMSVVFVTHDVDEAIMLADRVYTINSEIGGFHMPLTVDFQRPRSIDLCYSEKFQKYTRDLIANYKQSDINY